MTETAQKRYNCLPFACVLLKVHFWCVCDFRGRLIPSSGLATPVPQDGYGASCTRDFAPICPRGFTPVCSRGYAPVCSLFGPTDLTPPRCHIPTIAHQQTHAYGCRDTTALHDVRADADARDASLHIIPCDIRA